ncbi:hypothetical protein ACJMK2_008631 [Sinanodonta woodiana]|uniref:Hydroxylamine reductase n=1 Tax=Sinanodonta woodiana TaxID=1069815 RepID=A0ABD3VQ68_SINWO
MLWRTVALELHRSLNRIRYGLTPLASVTRVLGTKTHGPSENSLILRWAPPVRTMSSAAANQSTDMFCYQCEQAQFRKGCTKVGVCGKSPQVTALQDLLIYVVKGISVCANMAAKNGIEVPREVSEFVFKALFSTLTNVNFDASRFLMYIKEAIGYRDALRKQLLAVEDANSKILMSEVTTWTPDMKFLEATSLENAGRMFGVEAEREIYGADVAGVRHMVLYGIKGLAAYASHAAALGEFDPIVSKFIFEAFDFLETGSITDRTDLSKNLEMALRVGEVNMRVLELLDNGHRKQFGIPSPATVTTKPKEGKAILVSGHDLRDLATILKVADSAGINVYTHGELLPAHGYPNMRQFKSLAGHFGGAWQVQKTDFSLFPGPVVVTTNCVIEPLKSYNDRLYTLNECGVPGVKHVDINTPQGMSQIIEHAQRLEGFTQEKIKRINDRHLMVGFGWEAILGQSEKILKAVKTGALKRVFVIGGCDGSENKRSYFTTLAEALPSETLILTMGCAKYRFNDKEFGFLGDSGIPRLLDLGQCNDSYGAVLIAKTLAGALNTDVNSLPLSITLSWFEQKAVAVLLSLLSLGVQNIRVGPVLPAFLTPTVRGILEEKFHIVPVDIRHPLDDIKIMMA